MKYLIIILLLSLSCFSQVKYELPCKADILIKSDSICKAQIGVRELTGNNDGVMIEKYLASVGLNPKGKYPYCAAGQYYCYKTAVELLGYEAKDIPIAKTGLANGVYNDAKKRGKRVEYKSEVNDLIVYKNVKSVSGHIERIIKKLFGGWVDCVGFNTSVNKKGSQSNGPGVAKTRRNIYHPLSRLLAVRGLIGFRKI